MHLLFLVPTTGGPLVINALRVRPGLPASAAFAVGDYRPLPWSGDYARLSAPGGPLSAAIPGLAPHELRLSGSFDAGRSWEAPVALAHLLLARGHVLTDDPAESDAIIFATGAVDLDLELIPGDYALADKIGRLAELTARAPQTPVIAVLPGSGEDALFDEILRPDLVQCVPARRMTDAAAEIEKLLGAAAPGPDEIAPRAPPAGGARVRWAAPAAIGVLALIGGAGALVWREKISARPPIVHSTQPPSREGGEASAQTPNETGGSTRPEDSASPVEVSEVHARAGASCLTQLFGSGKTERRTVNFEAPDKLAVSRLTQDLCAIAIKPLKHGTRFAVLGDLASAALPPTTDADGAIVYQLKARLPQNIVYRIHVSKIDDVAVAGPIIRHEITP